MFVRNFFVALISIAIQLVSLRYVSDDSKSTYKIALGFSFFSGQVLPIDLEPHEQPPIRADGECGVANGKVFATEPVSTELCKTGVPSTLSKDGPWNWTCLGQGDGYTSSCAANLQLTTSSDRRTKIDYLYRMILLRPGDIEGLNYYSESTLTLEDVAAQFALSAEYNNRNFSGQPGRDTEFVESLYLIFLKRRADSDGKSYYIKKLTAETSRSSLVKEFYNSSEFKKLNPNL